MVKIKRKSILKNRDKVNFQKDTTIASLACIFFMHLSLILACIFRFLGFDTGNNEFFGTMYVLYCIITIGIIGFVNRDYILDKKVSRDKITIKTFCEGFTSMIAMMVIFTLPVILMDIILLPLGYTLENLASANSASDSITKFLYVAFIGPICEEVIFRGFVQRRLEKYSPVIAIMVSAISFALYHGNFAQVFPMIGVGLTLGYMAYKFSIKTSIAMHITYNLVFGELFGMLSDFLEKDGEKFLIPFLNITPFIATIMILTIIGIIVIFNHVLFKDNFPFKDYKIKLKNLFYFFTSSGMIIFTTISICTCIFFISPK